MIIEAILGNKFDPATETFNPADLEKLHEERVVLPSAQLVKRIQRVTTDHGRELGIRLNGENAPDLRDGDVLYLDGKDAIIISVEHTDVLVIAPESVKEMGVVAHNLGNRHMQAQFFGDDSDYGAQVMVLAYDHTVEDYLKHVGVPYSRRERVMPVPFRHAEHTH
ncbi:urease accessory protein [Arthrobacter stackebrandtii]|uniref:Urease accessory protein UreE n=1 Tax=Arthrobacter stackebrandtii TaxID=272161 RepID=A0ABS4Z217_9MICC|nr:urease accessory protein UreE [Arthrobacter stackebrandtii]MBP2414747.1 urease accessory protein [Arthrobacter stackebrandtii]PYG99417.1 urease accessory protein UreE [Arthrobacter stackebrandtii]